MAIIELPDAQGKDIVTPISSEARQAIGYAQDLLPVIQLLREKGYSLNSRQELTISSTGETYSGEEQLGGSEKVLAYAENVLGGISDTHGLENGVGLEFSESNALPDRRGWAKDGFRIDYDGLARYFGVDAKSITGPYAMAVRAFNGRLEEDERGKRINRKRSAQAWDFIAVVRYEGGIKIATGIRRREPLGDLHIGTPSTEHLDSPPEPVVVSLEPQEVSRGVFINTRAALEKALTRVPLRKPEEAAVA